MTEKRKSDDIPEIEITPEMIEAGAALLAGFSPLEDDPTEMACDVFEAMWAKSEDPKEPSR